MEHGRNYTDSMEHSSTDMSFSENHLSLAKVLHENTQPAALAKTHIAITHIQLRSEEAKRAGAHTASQHLQRINKPHRRRRRKVV